jgi:hypothetical protein
MLPSFPYLILAFYPQLSFSVFSNGQVILQDNGSGPYIAQWNISELAEPTEAELHSDSNELAAAKLEGNTVVESQEAQQNQVALTGLNAATYAAQCSLPPEQRLPKYQVAIDQINQIAIETDARQVAIEEATTVTEVNAIVYPPAAS